MVGKINYLNFFEEPMIEVATAVAIQTAKDLSNKLDNANEIINELVDDYIDIGFTAVNTKLINKATNFIKENK